LFFKEEKLQKEDWFHFILMVPLTLLTVSNLAPTSQLILIRVLVDY